MNKSSLMLVATSVLLIGSICGFNFVNAGVVYDIFPFPQSPTTIKLHQSIQLLAQVGYVESNGVPPANFSWFVNGVLAKSERCASSTFIFIANAVGTYRITATVNGYSNSQVVNVTVIGESTPTPSPPNITSLSLENKTYTTNHLSLNFTLSEPPQWVGYSLDGQANVTIDGNTTLPGLNNGQHTVNIYANDTNENFAQTQTITFTINKPSHFPSETVFGVVIIAIAAVIAFIVVSLLLLIRHRKTTNQTLHKKAIPKN
jgi:hypothetical protein